MVNESKLYSNRFVELDKARKNSTLNYQYFIDNYEHIINNTDLTSHISFVLTWMNEINYHNDAVYKLFLKGNKRHHQKGGCVSRILIFAPAHEKMVRQIFLEAYHSGNENFPFTIEEVLRDVNNARINLFDIVKNEEKYDYRADSLFKNLDTFNLFLDLYREDQEYTIDDLYAGLPKELQLGVLI